jgi:hypothetical protein
MSTHEIRGKKIVFTFKDGPMAGKSVEHAFHEDGSLDFAIAGGDADKKTHVKKYEAAKTGENVYAVSYLGDSGYTLTTVLDFATNELIAFSSNEKMLLLQHGSFELASGSKG